MDREKEIRDLLIGGGLGDLVFTWVEGCELPAPQRELLCHSRDMTSTLADYHGGPVDLEIVQEPADDRAYVREVLLKVGEKVVEYGLIRIYLESFPPDLRTQILAGKRPLGALLNESGLPYTSEPSGFLKIPSELFSADFFPPANSNFLFGRYNTLLDESGGKLARILEILPFEKS